MPPEGIDLYNLSGRKKWDFNLDFILSKINTASEKPVLMLESLIEQTTKEKDLLLDPFAGSGSFWEASLKLNRDVYLLEQSEERVIKEIIPRLQSIF